VRLAHLEPASCEVADVLVVLQKLIRERVLRVYFTLVKSSHPTRTSRQVERVLLVGLPRKTKTVYENTAQSAYRFA